MNSVEPPLFVRLYRCLTVNFCCKINYTGDRYSYYWSHGLSKAFSGYSETTN